MSQGNTACKTTSLDWYTNTVGETPCQTYQQLRQICNAGYTVGSLSPFTPPDRCDEQVASCCCNSVSFALSMLCLNCQQGVGTGLDGDNGIDAGIGAYQIYLGTCSPNTNQSMPNDIQAAVCNEEIKIEDDLYGLFWSDGSWYYMYTRETIQKNQKAKANNTYTHCNSTTTSGSTSMNTSGSASATSITIATSTHTSATSVTATISTNTSGSTSATSVTAATSTNTSGNVFATSITAATSTSTPTTSPAVILTNNTSSLNTGTISAIAVGSIVAALLFAGFIFWFLRRRRRRDGSPPNHVHSYSRPEMQPIVEPFTSFPSDGTSAALTSKDIRPFFVPSNIDSAHLFASSRSTKGRLAVESRPETDNSLPTTPTPAASAPRPANAYPLLSPPPPPLSEALPERHIDGGPLERSPSGRLPPAYGEQLVNT